MSERKPIAIKLFRTIIAFLMLSALVSGNAAYATHFRYGHYTWTHAGGNTVEVTLQNAFRRDGYLCVDPTTLSFIPCSPGDGLPQVGDIFHESIGFTQFNWGDGTPPVGSPLGALLYLVTAVDPANNWLFGLALDPASLPALDTTLLHTYTDPGDYTAFTDSCCRISAVAPPNEHLNNPDGGYRVETRINVGAPNNSPVSVLPPIVLCPIDALCTFLVPGADPDGEALHFRLSTSAEAASFSSFIQPGPPLAPNAASVDPPTGLYTWDTTGATLAGTPVHNTLYSTQVTIEDTTSKVALDFLIQLVEEDVNPPVLDPPAGSPPLCETTQVVTVGTTKTLDVFASDPDLADVVTLNAVGLPMGATMTPSLPIGGNPVSSTFSWTPDSDQVGPHVVNFTASSTGGGFALCPVTLEVTETPDCATADPTMPGAIVGTPGNDVLEGTDGPDLILAGGGNDLIKGYAGDDILCGEEGNDTIEGGAGDDVIEAGPGNDNVNGQFGADFIDAGAGADTVQGGPGIDVISGGPGNDLLKGQQDADIISGGEGADVIEAGAGDDVVNGDEGHDHIKGGPGHDQLDGGDGHDRLSCGPGVDTCTGETLKDCE